MYFRLYYSPSWCDIRYQLKLCSSCLVMAVSYWCPWNTYACNAFHHSIIILLCINTILTCYLWNSRHRDVIIYEIHFHSFPYTSKSISYFAMSSDIIIYLRFHRLFNFMYSHRFTKGAGCPVLSPNHSPTVNKCTRYKMLRSHEVCVRVIEM